MFNTKVSSDFLQCGKHSKKRSMASQKPQFRNLVDAGNYQMMHHSVQPSTHIPLAVTENERCFTLLPISVPCQIRQAADLFIDAVICNKVNFSRMYILFSGSLPNLAGSPHSNNPYLINSICCDKYHIPII